ncbi:alpha/beta fold hydrolase [Desulfobacterales bacterium HSG2]|nr:alpha/beta fold hydrolase [Desulfobacterales bacterium HSG2]
MEDDYKSENFYNMDRFFNAWQGKVTSGIPPTSMMLAYFDWAIHVANAPGKQWEIMMDTLKKSIQCSTYPALSAFLSDTDIKPPFPEDSRFSGEEWQKWPYNMIYQYFLLIQHWWEKATINVPGVSPHHQDMVSYAARQLLDILAPSNFVLTNPEVLRVTMEQGGRNLVRGLLNFLEDRQRAEGRPPAGTEDFRVGETLAVTPGKVIFRNRLIELIQYSPATEEVYAEPVLIVPAWIMKYYILDLSPHNSLIRYLVDQGHTVFMISWKNPGEADRDLGMDDYLTLGVMAAVNAAATLLPDRLIHAVGYCVGGTLLTVAAAAMSQEGYERLRTMTLLATQIDFTETGELSLFVDEGQLNGLEDVMREKGCPGSGQMASAFHLLRSNDLIWSRIIHDYLMGERQQMSDLLSWNADVARVPARMHSEYLKRLFLGNDLSEGRYMLDGRTIAVSDILMPVFLTAAVNDHVAPWRSVYKFHLLSGAEEVTFALTNGGHNAGIVSPPDHPRRTCQLSVRKRGEKYVDPDVWLKTAPADEGSWWIQWQEWLANRSSGMTSPPSVGSAEKGFQPICDAPGTYVLM